MEVFTFPHRQCCFVATLLLLLIIWYSKDVVSQSSEVPAIFVFGDSLVDVGNNNYLRSLARANYYPYGIDFKGGSTGRFTNGKNIADLFADLLGVPYVPAFADPLTTDNRILNGVCYGSAMAGILDETGRHFGDRYSLSQQVVNFESTLGDLRRMMSGGNLTRYLSKSIAILVFGSNDYINNYLLPPLYTSRFNYNPPQFANLLLTRYARQLQALQSVGLRKFVVAGVGPLGCIPNQRANNIGPVGRCVDNVNEMLGSFNEGLKALITQLNKDNPNSTFLYTNTYGIFGDILNNPDTFGFTVFDTACCGVGRNRGQISCLPLQFPCLNRSRYVFWDAFHPTEATSTILARRVFRGPPSDIYPINVEQLTLI